MAENRTGKDLDIEIYSGIAYKQAPRGSVLTTVATERTVKLYAVTQPELDSVSLLNALTLVFFSIGSLIVGFAWDAYMEWLFGAGKPAAPLALGLTLGAGVSYGVGRWMLNKRRTTLEDIKLASKDRLS